MHSCYDCMRKKKACRFGTPGHLSRPISQEVNDAMHSCPCSHAGPRREVEPDLRSTSVTHSSELPPNPGVRLHCPPSCDLLRFMAMYSRQMKRSNARTGKRSRHGGDLDDNKFRQARLRVEREEMAAEGRKLRNRGFLV